MSQIQEMIKPAAAMLDAYPVVTTKQKIKQWIKTCVPGMTPEKAAELLKELRAKEEEGRNDDQN